MLLLELVNIDHEFRFGSELRDESHRLSIYTIVQLFAFM